MTDATQQLAYTKIPTGYGHAGRICEVVAVENETVTVFVPQKRRVLSARTVPQTLVSFPLSALPEFSREFLRRRGWA